MIAVGIWATQRGGRAVWLVPLSFVLAMLGGGVLALSGVRLPLVESSIAASLVVLGLLVATATRLPLVASAAIVGLFAVAHGYSHGAELPAAASALSYVTGFALATASLLALGAGLGLLSKRLEQLQWTRVAGAAIAVIGVVVAIL
jgi:urease accessory protein